MKEGVPVIFLQTRNLESAFHIPGWLPRPGFNQHPGARWVRKRRERSRAALESAAPEWKA